MSTPTTATPPSSSPSYRDRRRSGGIIASAAMMAEGHPHKINYRRNEDIMHGMMNGGATPEQVNSMTRTPMVVRGGGSRVSDSSWSIDRRSTSDAPKSGTRYRRSVGPEDALLLDAALALTADSPSPSQESDKRRASWRRKFSGSAKTNGKMAKSAAIAAAAAAATEPLHIDSLESSVLTGNRRRTSSYGDEQLSSPSSSSGTPHSASSSRSGSSRRDGRSSSSGLDPLDHSDKSGRRTSRSGHSQSFKHSRSQNDGGNSGRSRSCSHRVSRHQYHAGSSPRLPSRHSPASTGQSTLPGSSRPSSTDRYVSSSSGSVCSGRGGDCGSVSSGRGGESVSSGTDNRENLMSDNHHPRSRANSCSNEDNELLDANTPMRRQTWTYQPGDFGQGLHEEVFDPSFLVDEDSPPPMRSRSNTLPASLNDSASDILRDESNYGFDLDEGETDDVLVNMVAAQTRIMDRSRSRRSLGGSCHSVSELEREDDESDGSDILPEDLDDEEAEEARLIRMEEESEALARQLMAEEAVASYSVSADYLRDHAEDYTAEDLAALQAAVGESEGQGEQGDVEEASEAEGNEDMSYEAMLRLGERIGDVKQERWSVVAREKIDLLPTFKFDAASVLIKSEAEKSPKDDDSVVRCLICQCSYEHEDDLRKLPCGHRFHLECVDQWLMNKDFCPYCRKSIVDGN